MRIRANTHAVFSLWLSVILFITMLHTSAVADLSGVWQATSPRRAGGANRPALFDTGIEVAITGEVTDFEFIAPHGYIHLRVVNDSGGTIAWEIETYPPGMLVRKGLTPETLHPGETISVVGTLRGMHVH